MDRGECDWTESRENAGATVPDGFMQDIGNHRRDDRDGDDGKRIGLALGSHRGIIRGIPWKVGEGSGSDLLYCERQIQDHTSSSTPDFE